MTEVRWKFANEEWEFEAIHRLNYAAFVEEIPQHAPNAERRLVDDFHTENTYAIALVGREVVGMLALRSKRPFSLDRKLEHLDNYLPPHRSMCEIRLFYILPAYRRGTALRGLMELVAVYAMGRGHDLAIISGTTRQQRLYRHFGFLPFGPLVGDAEARFQPMYLTLDAALQRTPWVEARRAAPSQRASGPAKYDPPANFQPGPVAMHPDVLAAMTRPPVSHRDPHFVADLTRVRAALCELAHARHVEVLFGSGTLGNEAVAGQLALLERPGLVLVNGEFGARLVDHARAWQLRYEVLEAAWGAPFDYARLARRLADDGIGWIWLAHSETSTGVLNDLPRLTQLCGPLDVKIAVDCVSTLGTMPLDLSQVWLATSTSGKALGALPGLALVFHNEALTPAPDRLPRYLDLGLYNAAQGVPFTILTSLVYALDAALAYVSAEHLAQTAVDSAELRRRLAAAGLHMVAPEEAASPAVTTVALPAACDSVAIGDALEQHGFLLYYRSRYLTARNWLQICLMGDYRADALHDLVDVLAALVHQAEGEGHEHSRRTGD